MTTAVVAWVDTGLEMLNKGVRPKNGLHWGKPQVVQLNFKWKYTGMPTAVNKHDYRKDRGLRTTSRQISFEFLFIKTYPPDKLHNGFSFVIQFRIGIWYLSCQGGVF